MSRIQLLIGVLAFGGLLQVSTSSAEAQIVPPSHSGYGNQTSTLNDTLINNLRATLPEQQQFIKRVTREVERGRLETGMVLAMMRYAQRRHSHFPFPYFERAMRFQAGRNGVALPSVITILSSRNPRLR